MQYETITDTSKNPRRQGSLDPTVPVKRSQGSLDPTVPVSDNNKTVISESGEKEKTAAEAKQDIKNAVPPAAGTERTEKKSVSSAVGKDTTEKGTGSSWQKFVIPVAALLIVFAIGAVVFHPFKTASSNDTGMSTSDMKAERPDNGPAAGEEAIVSSKELAAASSVTIEIPDPVLNKAILDATGSEDETVTGDDALLLTSLEYDGTDKKEKITDLTGLSEFPNLKYLNLRNNEVTDLTPL